MIILKELKWSNCFSYGSDNILDLKENIIVQLVGTNGTGKSSIPLLIEEALFNKNSKGVKKVDIVNRNSSDKGYTIHLDFEVDGRSYSIDIARKSSIKAVLLCDGEDISSHTATNTFKTISKVLGLDFKTFSQLVYQSTTNSLQFLTATDTNRKKFLIELLNLDHYLTLFDNFKVAHKEAHNEVSEIRGSIETIQGWIKANPVTSSTKKDILEVPDSPDTLQIERALVQSKLDNILSINNKINTNNQYVKQLNMLDSAQLTKSAIAPDSTAELNNEFIQKKSIIILAREELAKLQALGETCPTCSQEIDLEKTIELTNTQNNIIEDATRDRDNISTKVKIIKKDIAEYKQQVQLVQNFERLSGLIDVSLPTETEDKVILTGEVRELSSSILAIQQDISNITAENIKITKYNTELDYLLKQNKEFKLKLIGQESALKKTNEVYANLEVLKKAFSTNGLVAYKIENLVKDLEDLVNEYLGELSDGRFGLQFVISNDKLNVIISDEGRDIDILALSSGELARVNTSTLLAIRKLMSTLAKSRINVLFLDEVIGVLDDEGREKLIEVLLREHELNTFLVSHGWSHPLLSKINVIKENKTSRLEWQ